MKKGFFTGNLGKDPENKDVNGQTVVNFSISVTYGYGDNKKTEWVKVVKWINSGEKWSVLQFLKKGTKILVTGEVGIEVYISNSGEAKGNLVVNYPEIELLGSKENENENSVQENKPVQQEKEKTPVTIPDENGNPTEGEVDDMPF